MYLESLAIMERKPAEKFGDRLLYFVIMSKTKPASGPVGGAVLGMLETDASAEEVAIACHLAIIKQDVAESDSTT